MPARPTKSEQRRGPAMPKARQPQPGRRAFRVPAAQLAGFRVSGGVIIATVSAALGALA